MIELVVAERSRSIEITSSTVKIWRKFFMQVEMIGKYKIISVVAVGGMGTVYKAIHPSLKRQVIIKKLILKNGNSTIRERFKREARILLDLSSPYIVRMFDYFSEGRSDYIVLEFVDGMSLDKLIEKQISLPPQLALLIFLDACYGLKVAHSKNIVHRDIKPGNILISKRAEVKLADFGIASEEKEDNISLAQNQNSLLKSAQNFQDSQKDITQIGIALGTPAYMSPEQLEDSRSVDQRADIYSMGVMLYEMLTGSKPYSGDMAPETISKIKKGKYIAPEKLDKKIPFVARQIIKKMMKPNPQKRYQTIDPVIKKVKRYLKKYDTHAIRVGLAKSILSPSQIKLPLYQPKKHPARKAFLIFCGILCFAFLIAFAWKEGFFYRTILRPWFTRVTLTLEIPSTSSVNADLPARAFFFENDNQEIPEVKGSRRIFFMSKNKSTNEQNIKYVIKSVYLKPGEYRVKIAEGPYVYWQSFSVGKESKNLELNFLKNAKRNIKIHTSATDSQSGKDLSSKAIFKILVGNEWKNLNELDSNLLRTGNVYKILATCDGYKDEYFSLRLDWYQDELFINSSLEKK